MIAVIFEVWPKPEPSKDYLDLAAELRPLLEKIDGFISIERFESLDRARQDPLAVVLARRGGDRAPGAIPRRTGRRRPRAATRFSPTTACASPA